MYSNKCTICGGLRKTTALVCQACKRTTDFGQTRVYGGLVATFPVALPRHNPEIQGQQCILL